MLEVKDGNCAAHSKLYTALALVSLATKIHNLIQFANLEQTWFGNASCCKQTKALKPIRWYVCHGTYVVPVVQCIVAGEAFCRPRRNRVKMADSSDEVVPASLQCGICSQLCKRGVKVHSWLMISIQVFQFSFQQAIKHSFSKSNADLSFSDDDQLACCGAVGCRSCATKTITRYMSLHFASYLWCSFRYLINVFDLCLLLATFINILVYR